MRPRVDPRGSDSAEPTVTAAPGRRSGPAGGKCCRRWAALGRHDVSHGRGDPAAASRCPATVPHQQSRLTQMASPIADPEPSMTARANVPAQMNPTGMTTIHAKRLQHDAAARGTSVRSEPGAHGEHDRPPKPVRVNGTPRRSWSRTGRVPAVTTCSAGANIERRTTCEGVKPGDDGKLQRQPVDGACTAQLPRTVVLNAPVGPAVRRTSPAPARERRADRSAASSASWSGCAVADRCSTRPGEHVGDRG